MIQQAWDFPSQLSVRVCAHDHFWIPQHLKTALNYYLFPRFVLVDFLAILFYWSFSSMLCLWTTTDLVNCQSFCNRILDLMQKYPKLTGFANFTWSLHLCLFWVASRSTHDLQQTTFWRGLAALHFHLWSARVAWETMTSLSRFECPLSSFAVPKELSNLDRPWSPTWQASIFYLLGVISALINCVMLDHWLL